jgi:hypothetical protein
MSREFFFGGVATEFQRFHRKSKNLTKSRVTLANLDKNGSVPPSPSVVILIFAVRPIIFAVRPMSA